MLLITNKNKADTHIDHIIERINQLYQEGQGAADFQIITQKPVMSSCQQSPPPKKKEGGEGRGDVSTHP